MNKNYDKVMKRLDNIAAVHQYLRHHKGEGAIFGTQIMDECDIKAGPELRRCINSLRNNGVPVCSNSNGYWLAVTDEEVLETVKQLKGRAYAILAAAYRMQSSLINQDDIFDDEDMG